MNTSGISFKPESFSFKDCVEAWVLEWIVLSLDSGFISFTGWFGTNHLTSLNLSYSICKIKKNSILRRNEAITVKPLALH